MQRSISAYLIPPALLLLATTGFAQRPAQANPRSGGGASHTPSPAPARQSPSPAPARPSPAPAPAPIQRQAPPPTRSYSPPAPAPSQRHEPVRRSEPPTRTYNPPAQPSRPAPAPSQRSPSRGIDTGYQPSPPSRIDRGYSPPARVSPPVGGDRGERISTPDPGGSGPIRIVYPGDRDTGASPPPAIGGPVRSRLNTGFRPSEPRPPAAGSGSSRSGPSPDLRDLYRRVDNSRHEAENRRVGPILGDSLAGRYRQRFDSDLDRAGRRPAEPAPIRGEREAPAPAPIRGNERLVSGGRPPVVGDRYQPPGREPIARSGATQPPRAAPDPIVMKPTPLQPITRRDMDTVGAKPGPGAGVRNTPGIVSMRNVAFANNPRGYMSGSSHWSSHGAGMWFGSGWCSPSSRWGWYAYPYNYGCWWPRSWWGCYNSCNSYWNSCWSPCWNYCSWWPSYWNCYSPIGWDNWWSDSYWGGYTDVWNYPRQPSTVVVHDVVYEEAPASEVIVVGGRDEAGAAAGAAPASPAAIAKKHIELGDFYFKEGRFQEAAESYLRALAYAPDDAALHFVLADALFATGDYHYAAFIIGKALRLDRELVRVVADKRTFYKEPKVFDEQLATLRSYLKDKPYDAAAWLVLGYNLKFSSDPTGAKAAFARALEIDPGQEAARLFAAAGESAESKPTSR